MRSPVTGEGSRSQRHGKEFRLLPEVSEDQKEGFEQEIRFVTHISIFRKIRGLQLEEGLGGRESREEAVEVILVRSNDSLQSEVAIRVKREKVDLEES